MWRETERLKRKKRVEGSKERGMKEGGIEKGEFKESEDQTKQT